MRPATRVIVLAALLVGPLVLAPSASAEWKSAHAWSWQDARKVLAWTLDESDTFRFATLHEEEFLLYEEGQGHNVTAWFVRPYRGIERVTVAQVDGKWGVMWQEFVPEDQYRKGVRSPIRFAWPVTDTEVRIVDLEGGFPAWSQARYDPVTRDMHFLHMDDWRAVRYSLRAGAWDLDGVTASGVLVTPTGEGWASNVTQLLTSHGEVRLRENGDVFAVQWSTNGAHAVTWNLTAPLVRHQLSPYWDYQAGRIVIAPNGTLGTLLSYRRDACDLFVKHAGANWSSERVEPCPLANTDLGVAGLQLREGGRLDVLTRQGFWSPGVERPEPFPCNDAPWYWLLRADGREFMLGPGPTVWERVHVPELVPVSDPANDAPTGLAVSFRLEGNLSVLTNPLVKWQFPGRAAEGQKVTHAFFAPGAWDIRVIVESGPEHCRSKAATLTIPFEATGEDRSSTVGPDSATAEAGNESQEGEGGGRFLPAPAVLPALAAVAVAVALARRR